MATKEPAAAYPSRTRHRLETRDRVFDAALAEFRRVGVSAAQIEEIVRQAGVARGTFYLHFPTKDHVLMELLRRNQAALAERLRSTRATSTRVFLRRLADFILDDAQGENGALWHELFSILGRHAPELRTEENPLVEAISAYLAAAQDRGELRHDLGAFDLTSVFLPGVLGLLQMRLDDPVHELRQALYRVVDIFVRGIETAST